MSAAIVVNATNIGRYIDGIGVYTLNLLRELSQLGGHHRFIIYLNRSCADQVEGIRFPDHWEIHWVSSLMSPDHGFKGHFIRLLFSNYLGLKHRHSILWVTGQLEAILMRKNQIITVHDIIPLLFRKLHKKQYFYFKYVLKLVLSNARWIITPSYHTQGLLVERYGIDESRVHVIHNGVRDSSRDDSRDSSARSDGEFILFSGRMVPMKNLGGVLDAFNLIKDKVPHRVVITGHNRRNSSSDASTAVPSNRAVGRDRVEFKGHVSSKEMEDLLNRASLVVFPSFYEGFGLPPLEGMAHGCPVVVSNVSSLPEVCGDAAEYVDPKDIHSIADGMYKVLTEGSLRRSMIKKGFARARRFSWEKSAKEHLAVFDEAIDVTRPPMPIYGLQPTGFVDARRDPLPIGAHGFYGMQSGSQR
jgi:glycosyltransferase involved in cell wall biosynthesis